MIVSYIATSTLITKQIINLLNSIIAAKRSNTNIILCGNFVINNKEYPVNEIINTKVFYDNFRIELYPSNIQTDYQVSIAYVYYGIDKINKIDVTNIATEYFNINERLVLNTDTNLNKIFTDPFPDQPKKLFIGYNFNNKLYEYCVDEFGGYLQVPIIISKMVTNSDIILDRLTGPFKILHYESICHHLPFINNLIKIDYRKLLVNDFEIDKLICQLIN